MNFISKKHLSRRTLLRGMGVSVFYSVMAAPAGSAPAPFVWIVLFGRQESLSIASHKPLIYTAPSARSYKP